MRAGSGDLRTAQRFSTNCETGFSSRILLESQLLESVDPHGLAPWVNEIGRLHRTSTAIADPHELASWVNEIPGCRTEPSATGANASPLAFNLVHPRGKLAGVLSQQC